jgi:hypothetical protein
MTKKDTPTQGDFVVSYEQGQGFVIERRTSSNTSERVAFERNRLDALKCALSLAREAGTKAWTYELDNQFVEIR